ncbi:MAG TPA: hypothetical protein VIH72_09350 [Candidatus Acidoferrales bacterium]|jgi:hypothetical protein
MWWDPITLRQAKDLYLEQGEYDDLVRGNRKRWMISLELIAIGMLSSGIFYKVNPSSPWHKIGVTMGVIVLIAGLALGRIAYSERCTLDQRRPPTSAPPDVRTIGR